MWSATIPILSSFCPRAQRLPTTGLAGTEFFHADGHDDNRRSSQLCESSLKTAPFLVRLTGCQNTSALVPFRV